MAAAAFAPRQPVERRSGSMDHVDHEQRRLVDWKNAVIKQGAAELEAARDLQNVQTYIDLLDGSWWGTGRPDWRSSFYDNYLADQRRESLAALTDIKPTIDISCKVKDYQHQAEIAHKIIRHEWVNSALDLKLADWVDHALFGTGFWKMVAYEPGIMEVSAHALGQVLPVQMDGNDLQTAAAVVYRSYQSLSYFIQKFGAEKCEGLERYSVELAASLEGDRYNRPDNIPEYQWSTLSPAMKRRMHLSRNNARPEKGYPGATFRPYPIIELQEFYHDDPSINEYGHPILMKHPDLPVSDHNYHYIVQPKGRLYPRKRLTIFGGDKCLYDGPAPFWDGMYPFIMLQLNPCVWAPGGVSKYRDLIPLTRSINRIGAGVDECVIDAVNRTVVSRKGAIDPVSWDRFDPGRPKQKLLLNGTADPTRDIRYLEAKQIPQYVDMWLKYLDMRIQKRSGALDISGLSRKKQAPGGDTIASMQDAMSGPYRLEARYVEEALRQAAIMAVSRIFQFWTLDQRLRLLGPDGQTWEDYDYQAQSMIPAHAPKEDHWKLFPVNVAQGSMHGATEAMKRQIAVILRRQHDLSIRGLYDKLNIGLDADEEIARLAEEQKMGIGVAPPGGRGARLTRSQRQGSPI